MALLAGHPAGHLELFLDAEDRLFERKGEVVAEVGAPVRAAAARAAGAEERLEGVEDAPEAELLEARRRAVGQAAVGRQAGSSSRASHSRT